MIDKYLSDLEKHIQPDTEDRLYEDWVEFTENRFDGYVFRPKREQPVKTDIDWPRVSVNAALNDYDAMALQQYGACARRLAKGSGEFMCVRANYGTSIVPSLFGVDLFYMDEASDTLPTSYPLGSDDRVKALLDREPPAVEDAFDGKVLDMGRRFVSIAKRYPKIGRYVHIYHPDLQGPLDVCEVIWGSCIMTKFYEAPDLVKALLERVTETYIRLMRAWSAIVPFNPEYNVHWGLLHRGSIMLRDDSAMNISPDLFDKFVAPYDQRLLDEFGGGAIHFCGRGDHYIDRFPRMNGVFAVNLSQPDYNDMETIYRNTIDQGIKILGLPEYAVEAARKAERPLHGNVHTAGDPVI